MTEVQAEFDKIIKNYYRVEDHLNKLDELIAKGAKFTYKDGAVIDAITNDSFDTAVWMLDNIEISDELINDLASGTTTYDYHSLNVIMRSKKCAVYLTKMIYNKNTDPKIKASLRQIFNIPEVKEVVPEPPKVLTIQEEFDELYDNTHNDKTLAKNRSKLEELIAKGAKVNYVDCLLESSIGNTDPETGIWYLNHLEPCKEVIDEMIGACQEKYTPILEIIMRCNKFEYYLQKLAESDKVDAELRNTIERLLKPQTEEKKLSEFDRYKIVVEFFKDADEYVEDFTISIGDLVLLKSGFDIKADWIKSNPNLVRKGMFVRLYESNPDISECLKVSDVLNNEVFNNKKPTKSDNKINVQKHLIENCDQVLFDYFVANKFAKTLDFMREATKKQEGEHENAKVIRKMFKALG
jgi:hypothetical protein